MKPRAQSAQQGFILIAVVFIGLISTMLMGAALQSTVVTEGRAVDQRLAEIRAYWATMGHFQYGFSRIRQDYMCADASGICNSTDSQQDVAMVPVLQSYLNEITAQRHVTFREENTNYHIDISTQAFRDPGAAHNHSMHLGMRSSFPGTQSTIPVLANIAQRASPLEVQFCVQLAAWTNPCGALSSNNFGGTLNGYYRVKKIIKL